MAKTMNELLYEATGYFLTSPDPGKPMSPVAKKGLSYIGQLRDMCIDMESSVIAMCNDLRAIMDSCEKREKSGISDPRDRLLWHTARDAIRKAPDFGRFGKPGSSSAQPHADTQPNDSQPPADFNSTKTQDSRNLS